MALSLAIVPIAVIAYGQGQSIHTVGSFLRRHSSGLPAQWPLLGLLAANNASPIEFDRMEKYINENGAMMPPVTRSVRSVASTGRNARCHRVSPWRLGPIRRHAQCLLA